MPSQARVAKPNVRNFLLTGHPRGATGYSGALMCALGFKVGHEKVREDGIASWALAVNAPKMPRIIHKGLLDRHNTTFRSLIHVVRHPVDTIASSAYAESPPSLRFRSRYVLIYGRNEIERAVRSYIAWHKMIIGQRPDFRFQAESSGHDLVEYLVNAGFMKQPTKLRGLKVPSRKHNSREHRKLTWGDIEEACPADLFVQLRVFAKQLGYKE